MDAACALRIAIYRDDLAHHFFVGEDLVGPAPRLGSQCHRPSDVTR
jgi:hypothetical protein